MGHSRHIVAVCLSAVCGEETCIAGCRRWGEGGTRRRHCCCSIPFGGEGLAFMEPEPRSTDSSYFLKGEECHSQQRWCIFAGPFTSSSPPMSSCSSRHCRGAPHPTLDISQPEWLMHKWIWGPSSRGMLQSWCTALLTSALLVLGMLCWGKDVSERSGIQRAAPSSQPDAPSGNLHRLQREGKGREGAEL